MPEWILHFVIYIVVKMISALSSKPRSLWSKAALVCPPSWIHVPQVPRALERWLAFTALDKPVVPIPEGVTPRAHDDLMISCIALRTWTSRDHSAFSDVACAILRKVASTIKGTAISVWKATAVSTPLLTAWDRIIKIHGFWRRSVGALQQTTVVGDQLCGQWIHGPWPIL